MKNALSQKLSCLTYGVQSSTVTAIRQFETRTAYLPYIRFMDKYYLGESITTI
jgi:hypothetical protein